MAKYSVEYVSGSTGYGWTREYNNITDFEDFINEMRHVVSAAVRVYDYDFGKFIFWKDAFTYNLHIDLLRDQMRDLRTVTRRRK